MTYLVWYLVAGVTLAPLLYFANSAASKCVDKTPEFIVEDDFPKRSMSPYQWLKKIANLLLILIITILVWPLIVYSYIREPRLKKRSIEDKLFGITHKDLQQVMRIEDIEKQETPVDPMNAVPDLPFGHLNNAWNRFKAGLTPQDVLWRFSTEWVGEFESRSIRGGYVAVRDDQIGLHFLTTERSVSSHKNKTLTSSRCL